VSALPLRVETATAADLPAIRGAYANAQVMQRAQHAPEWPGFADESILREIGDGRLYRIMDGDAIAGGFTIAYDVAAIWGDLERGAHIYLHRIARTEHRASGRLMDAVMDWSLARCEELGREGLRIDTWAANPALQAYYGSFGFTLVATRRMGNDPRLSPHYVGLELALMERPGHTTATTSSP
jgi:hypothetical protein